MARKPNTETGRSKGQQISVTVPQDLYDALEDYRWTARIDGMSKLGAVALQEYADNHGLTVGVESGGEDTPPSK